MESHTDRVQSILKALADKGRWMPAPAAPRGDAARAVSRRHFLQLGAVAGAGVSLSGAVAPHGAAAAALSGDPDTIHAPSEFNEATIAQLQAAMATGHTSAVELTRFYLDRIAAIDRGGPVLNSIIELNPDALAIAAQAD